MAHSVPLVNPDNIRAGKYLATHQIFGSAGLHFGAYQRNRFDEAGSPTGIKNCLRLTATARINAREYGSPHDENQRVRLELEGDALMQLHAVLAGRRASYTYELVRAGTEKKVLEVKYQASGRAPFFVRLSEGNRNYATPFGLADSYAIQMAIGQVLAAQFPGIAIDFLMQRHLSMSLLEANERATSKA